MKKTVEFNAQLPVTIKKDKHWTYASCPILDIHTQGENITKAKSNLSEAIYLFFVSCFERNTLDEALKQCGFQLLASHQAAKKVKSKSAKQQYINVPISFLVENQRSAECRA